MPKPLWRGNRPARSRSLIAPPLLRSSSNRWGVLDAAGVPQLIESARNGELGFRAQVALEDFAVVSYIPDNIRRPVVAEPDLLAEDSAGADQAHNLGLLRFQRLIDGL